MKNTEALVRGLSQQRCACVQPTTSGLVSFCPGTRQTRNHRTPVAASTCLACQARDALEADGLGLDDVARGYRDERRLTIAQRMTEKRAE